MTRSPWKAVAALSAVALASLLGACGGDDDEGAVPGATDASTTTTEPAPATSAGGTATSEGGAGLDEGPVIVESAEVVPGAAPVLEVRGQLPTPCHQAASEVSGTGSELEVRVFSLVDPSGMCAQVVQPFTLAVPLGEMPPSPVAVTLNGEPVGTLG